MSSLFFHTQIGWTACAPATHHPPEFAGEPAPVKSWASLRLEQPDESAVEHLWPRLSNIEARLKMMRMVMEIGGSERQHRHSELFTSLLNSRTPPLPGINARRFHRRAMDSRRAISSSGRMSKHVELSTNRESPYSCLTAQRICESSSVTLKPLTGNTKRQRSRRSQRTLELSRMACRHNSFYCKDL